MSAPLFSGASVASIVGNINPNISMTDAMLTDTGASAQAFITIQNDGDLLLQTQNSGTTTVTDEWILDADKVAGVGDDYEIFCTVNSGALDTGTSSATDTWLDMATTQYSWGVSEGVGIGVANFTLTIRDKTTLTPQATATFDTEIV